MKRPPTASQLAARCPTCKRSPEGTVGTPRDGIGECLQCGESIAYYSCAPGYCRLCAHDPRWKPLADAP